MRKLTSIFLVIAMGLAISVVSGISPFAVIPTLFASMLVFQRFGGIPQGSLMMAFVDLSWPSGKQNMAGVVGDIYYCPVDDIESLPALSAAGALDTVAEDIVCKSTKKFIKIYHTADTGKLDDTTVGERDGKSKESLLEFMFPGGGKDVAEFERQALNTPCVVICKDTDGNLRLLGVVNLDPTSTTLTMDIPCYFESGAGTTGAARADRRGKTFQFKHNAPHAPIYYKGTIPLTPAA